ncbi:MAG: FtsW/RodA/SpoVE family cell cycle protein [Armatimonadetes bacterium]|nr:FtsW/RodA/SpoVE family cell cycle protein [Armatimonadota bacterium]
MTRSLKFDPFLIGAALIATVLGLIAIWDAGYARAAVNGTLLPREFWMQGIFSVLSVGLGLACAKITVQKWEKLASWLMGLGLFGLLLVELPVIGKEIGGARRWIDLKVMTIQPSEFVKLAAIIYLAAILTRHKPWEKPKFKNNRQWVGKVLIPKIGRALPFLPVLLSIALIEHEPDLATAMVVVVVMYAMMFVGGVSWKSMALMSLIGAAFAGYMIMDKPYRIERILNHSSRWSERNIEDIGYQTTQSEMAMASGGMIGHGLGEGRAKHTLPAPTTDFIIATVAEEFGLVGSLVILALMGTIALRLALLSFSRRESFDRLLLLGVAVWIGVQSATNIMMANGTLPPIGLPLAFFSYGGSSLLAIWAAIGICTSVLSRQESLDEDDSEPPVAKKKKRKFGVPKKNPTQHRSRSVTLR